MGKDDDKSESQDCAFTRMNYLYQAAHLISKTSSDSPLGTYYVKLMKEISKKVVEKLHPDLKRTVCLACNYALTADNTRINVKIKPSRKKRKKTKIKSESKTGRVKIWKGTEKLENCNSSNRYKKSRIDIKNKKPNKVKWSCSKCAFSKSFLQQPNYKIWVHKHDEGKIH